MNMLLDQSQQAFVRSVVTKTSCPTRTFWPAESSFTAESKSSLLVVFRGSKVKKSPNTMWIKTASGGVSLALTMNWETFALVHLRFQLFKCIHGKHRHSPCNSLFSSSSRYNLSYILWSWKRVSSTAAKTSFKDLPPEKGQSKRSVCRCMDGLCEIGEKGRLPQKWLLAP